MSQPKKLHELKPREQVGARTASQYEYQYHQAAGACLHLIESTTENECVFCEWHDDFVIERSATATTMYVFHQVKTRTLSDGPWGLRELFGLGRKKTGRKAKTAPAPSPAHSDCIVARMIEHYLSFEVQCEQVVLVTNGGFATDVTEFLKAIASSASATELPKEHHETFEELCGAYGALNVAITRERMFSFLKRLRLQAEAGNLKDLKSSVLLLADRITKTSEVDLKLSEARKIGQDLIDLVRAKSQAMVPEAPSEQALRTAKGVTAEDVLPVISLSPEGFRELNNDPQAVRTLSRLDRLCRAAGFPSTLIGHICRFKSEWDAFWLAERHHATEADIALLKNRCSELLTLHSTGKLGFEALAKGCDELAKEFAERIGSTRPLTNSLVLGLVFAICAGSA